MAVQVVFVLMDPEEGLEAAKEPVYEFPSDLKTLGRSDPLVFVKADDVVGIHPARVFSPLLLLVQEAPIHAFSIYLIRTLRRTYAMTLLIAPWLFAALLMTLLIAISLRCPFYIR